MVDQQRTGEERQVEPGPGVEVAGAELFRLLLESRPRLVVEIRKVEGYEERIDDAALGRRFARRTDRARAHPLDRALGEVIEAAQALDLIAEQLDAVRMRRRRREYVHDTAAAAHVAGNLDQADALVPQGLQPR